MSSLDICTRARSVDGGGSYPSPQTRVSDPHPFLADPDPDPDPGFEKFADADPDPGSEKFANPDPGLHFF